jgi:CHAT domain-containing protein
MSQRLHSLIVDLQGEEFVYQYMCREGDTAPPLATFRKRTQISQLKELAEGLSRVLESGGTLAAARNMGAELREWGGKLCDKVFPSELVERLTADPKGSSLVLYLDPALVWLPWEVLWDGAEFFSRRFRVARLQQKTASELRAAEQRLREARSGRGALIIFGDVSGLQAYAEKTEIEKALSPLFGSNIWFYSAKGAADVLEQLKQDYEICHFIGHGKYVEGRPEETGWVFADRTVLTCGDLEAVSSRAVFPLLIFANSCDSAHPSSADREGYVSTLYRAFLRRGVPQYIGTIAPILDEPSKAFASSFYRMLVKGMTIGEALGESARVLADSAGMPLWPYYVHYGDPTCRLGPRSTTLRGNAPGEGTVFSLLGRLSKEEIQRMLEHYRNATAKEPGNGDALYGLALCYLQLGLFDLAIGNFKRTMELMPECADAYYFYSLALIRGRRPKTLALKEVQLIEQYLATALQLNDRQAKYYYLAAILKFDYYLSNGLLVRPPSPDSLLAMAEAREYDPWEIERLLHLVPLRDQRLIAKVRRTIETSTV